MQKFSKQRALKFWQQSAKPYLVLILVTCIFRSAVADWNDVPTGSMKPTIIEGDRVFVNKLAYDLKIPFTTLHLAEWSNPERGEVVVFFSPADEKRLVKRVIGLPGDRIELRDNHLWVNGEAVKYESLNQEIIDEIPTAEQPAHGFAKENLPDMSHAVMSTPANLSKSSFMEITVPEGAYFMMGDNRDNSFDSRFFGCVERRRIVGRASAVVISLDRANYYQPRWHRFFTAMK